MLSPIANPLASEEESRIILDKLSKIDNPVSGIKPCIKKIKKSVDKNLLCVISGDIFPIDLVSHIPGVCEEYEIPYIFVPNRTWIKGFTCIIISYPDELKRKLWIYIYLFLFGLLYKYL